MQGSKCLLFKWLVHKNLKRKMIFCANINYAFLTRASIYYVSFFLKFLQINNIPYLLAVQKIFLLKFMHAKLSILNSPCLQNWACESKIDWDTHLMPYLTFGRCWYP